MDLEIRAITAAERDDFRRSLASTFGFDVKEDDEERRERFARTLELDRSIGAFDGGRMVGTGAALSLELTIPGAAAATGGTTMISVLPTHRRRGVLREMMRFHMDEVREREETLAALWASESVIYGRFGYGKAVLRNRVEIERRHAAMLPGIEPAGVVDLVPPETTLEHLRPVYQRMLPTRPGMYARSEQWWRDHSLHDPEDERRGASRYRYAIYHEDGETLGYAQYRVKSKWDDWNPASTVDVVEMLALTPGASAGLWRFLSGIDLVEKIEAWNRPEDEPLAWLLADPRRLRSMPGDSMWLRLVDVPAALAARRYRIPGRLVLEVRDAFCPWNEGRYRLEGDRGDAACERTDADPDLVLDARDLGAVYLGGARMAALSRAGLIHGGRAAVETADLMFSWDPPPWCPEVF